MPSLKVLNINRRQLSEFIKDHKTIVEFEKLFSQDTDFNIIMNNVLDSLGIGEEGIYLTRSGSHYLDGSPDMYSDSTLLDNAIFDYTREAVTTITLDAGILPTAQTVLCDTTLGNITVTLPPPASSFSGGRSFRFAIHKIDDTVNTITILPNASELIVGASSQLLKRRGDVLNFITDGTNWYLNS